MEYSLTDKLMLVYPNTEWVRDGDNYSDLVFLDNTQKLEESEFLALAEIKIQEKEESDRIAAEEKAQNRAIILERLGLTEEEVKILLG